jgi:hypothetical protein
MEASVAIAVEFPITKVTGSSAAAVVADEVSTSWENYPAAGSPAALIGDVRVESIPVERVDGLSQPSRTGERQPEWAATWSPFEATG